MRIGILGSGIVGQTVGAKLVELGHDVVLGTRDPGKLQEWLVSVGGRAGVGSFADAAAKARVAGILTGGFGWRNVIDLGDVTTARGAEMLLPVWIRLLGALGPPMFNFKIVR